MLEKNGLPAIESCVKNVEVLSIIGPYFYIAETITDIQTLAEEIRCSNKPVSSK